MAKKSQETSAEKPFAFANNLLDKIDALKSFRQKKIYIPILIIVGLLLLAVYKKNWFIAATINGSPITNLDLQMRLNQQFRSQTLNQMINEKIILDEANKNNIVVSDLEIGNKISEIETSVGGAQALDAMLAQQGQTRESIKQQIKLQLTVEKLYSNEATVSAEEVSTFIEQNKENLRATDSAKQQEEAYNAIKNQKLTQIFSQKFQELKTKAKIQIF